MVTIVAVDKKTVEIDSTIFSHMLNCHGLHLVEWGNAERSKFVKYLNGGLDRVTAEQHLDWLYTELEKIEDHRIANNNLKRLLHEALVLKS